mmetsp:Transcript_39526/g.55693  ORF Transcript_39526/g.55693 Transcript_39526/m.55693 type:complete len:86 (+) Transcript_39526:119-376(+)
MIRTPASRMVMRTMTMTGRHTGIRTTRQSVLVQTQLWQQRARTAATAAITQQIVATITTATTGAEPGFPTIHGLFEDDEEDYDGT